VEVTRGRKRYVLTRHLERRSARFRDPTPRKKRAARAGAAATSRPSRESLPAFVVGFPVLDRFRETVYVIAGSNHGLKMIDVGELVAGELTGEPLALLQPFRFARCADGRLHPVPNSPFPWS
jgi:hypothetical protein